MKRFFIFALSLLALSVFGSGTVFAQQGSTSNEVKATVIADVSIRNLLITEKTDKDIKISLQLVNNGDAISGVTYGFELLSGIIVTDFKSVTGPTALASKERKTIEAVYTFPAIPSGIYSLSFKASTVSGMPLASSRVSNLDLATKNIFGIVPGSCVLRVRGEPATKTYSTTQGVDILPSEKLVASCEVTNTLPFAVNLTPITETFLRNRLGQKVSQKVFVKDVTTVTPLGKKTIAVELEIPEKAQAYDTVLSFNDERGVESNTVAFHYVVRGKSATIQSVSLDKTSYGVGDSAKVSVRWTASADSFPDSRLGSGTLLAAPAALIRITSEGALCMPEISKPLTGDDMVFSLVTETPCSNPKLEVSLRDEAQTLAKAEYHVGVPTPAASGEGLFGMTGTLMKLVIAVVVILALIIFSVIVVKRKKKIIPPVAVLLLMAGAFAFGAHALYAATITWTDKGGHDHQATVDLTKDTYSPSEPVILDANFDSWYQWCTNGAKKDVYFGYVVKDSGGNVVAQGDPSKLSGQVTVYDPDSKGQLTPGAYTVKAVFGSNIMQADQWTTSTCEVVNVDSACINELARDYYWNGDESQCMTVTTQTCQVPTHYSLTDQGSYGSVDLNFTVEGPVNTNYTPDGVLDGASCDGINGWALDKDVSDQSIQIHIYKNGPAGSGTIVGGYTADQYRPDVNDALHTTGNHGFGVPIPDSLKTGQSTQIYVYAIGRDDAGNPDGNNPLLSGSPKTINCQPPVNPPQTCQDTNATNFGSPLPCTYPGPSCTDPSANNYGGSLPCTYSLCQDLAAQNYGGRLPCTYPPNAFGVSIRSSTNNVTLTSANDSSRITIYSQANVPQGTTLTQHGLEYRFNGGAWSNTGAWNDLIPNQERQTDASFLKTVISVAGTHEFKAYGSNDGGATYFYTSPVTITAVNDGSCTDTSCGGGGNGVGDGGGGGNNNPFGFTITSAEGGTTPIQFVGGRSATSSPRRLEVNPVGVFANPVDLRVTGISSKSSGASLPSNVTPSYSFDGRGPAASLGYNGAFGRYVSQMTGLIGTTFEVGFSAPITEPYNITIEGVSGNILSTYVLTVDPSNANPFFREI